MHPTGPFLNLSNHPQHGWGEAQRQAALALGTEVLDHPFPAVPPEATTQEVEELAHAVVQAVPEGIVHALVMGEHTLVPLLVAGLQARGVTCYATTSRRQSHQNGDTKVSRFEFVALRPYPPLTRT